MMATKATYSAADSHHPRYALDERVDCTVTPLGHEFLVAEEQDARRDWITTLLAIPTKPGKRRTDAVAKTLRLRERYERLIGHQAGHPPADD